MMMQTISQRLTITLPLVGVAFLLASMLLPFEISGLAWGIALISFVVALMCAIVDQRRRRAERPNDLRR